VIEDDRGHSWIRPPGLSSLRGGIGVTAFAQTERPKVRRTASMAGRETQPLLLIEGKRDVLAERKAAMLLRGRGTPPRAIGEQERADIVTSIGRRSIRVGARVRDLCHAERIPSAGSGGVGVHPIDDT
jgi:hypothetical protein